MRNLLTVQNKSGQISKASFLPIQLELAGKLKTSFDFEKFIVKMAFLTNVVDLQAALSACSSTQEWQMLMDSVLIPDEWMAMAYARLTELTVQELEVS